MLVPLTLEQELAGISTKKVFGFAWRFVLGTAQFAEKGNTCLAASSYLADLMITDCVFW
jgi:hypothetical protein